MNQRLSESPVARPFRIPGADRPGDLRFAYFNLKGHPRGELMLHRLIGAGFVPSLVIDEDSPLAAGLLAAQFRQLGQVAAFTPPTPLETVCKTLDIRYETVGNHNDADTVAVLAEAAPSLGVLGDTRIMRARVIDALPHGIVNVHPGLLPSVRGNNPYLWSVVHGLPQGATAHLIDTGVDRGPIMLARELELTAGTTLPELIHTINTLCADVVVTALSQLTSGTATLTEQPADDAVTFREARPEIWSLVETILRERAGAAARR
ncbi:hypothetical protein BAY61_17745 [Prauserella marina]|uniref:Formyl transferase n=1 Tax=Prauserella marina TaxID=530584 RepID=A0A222VRL4_9PSEU|nr:formyltransferase family protein [Prauserella marina]ASR36539.1 hypothetical protein BAY61_17745 [Prauserella marina]PWV73934.1 formyl transferase-like protein [Prauserella marina]SDD59290.1 Formyl transferase [Prauserella marina]